MYARRDASFLFQMKIYIQIRNNKTFNNAPPPPCSILVLLLVLLAREGRYPTAGLALSRDFVARLRCAATTCRWTLSRDRRACGRPLGGCVEDRFSRSGSTCQIAISSARHGNGACVEATNRNTPQFQQPEQQSARSGSDDSQFFTLARITLVCINPIVRLV